MDCVYSWLASQHPGGSTEAHAAPLRQLLPARPLGTHGASLQRIAGTRVDARLGNDAGQRVLEGKISRGVADRISAVLWFSDLRGYTEITDAAPPREIIPLLNDYADVVIS